MGRPLRQLVENGIYHVYNRANNRRSIHLAEDTHHFFRQLLENLSKFKITPYAYCVMTNHYHILLHTKKANLDKGMKSFGESLSRYINLVTNASGPVFESRYKSKLIKNDSYLLQACRYIHLNPVEAEICANIHSYKWSSIHDYRKAEKKTFIDTSFILDRFQNYNEFDFFHSYGNDDEQAKNYLESTQFNNKKSRITHKKL